MTLTPARRQRRRGRVVLITGADKAAAVAAWLQRDPLAARLPIARVRRTGHRRRPRSRGRRPARPLASPSTSPEITRHHGRARVGGLTALAPPAHLATSSPPIPTAAERYLLEVGDLRIDYAKQRVDDAVMAALLDVADAAGVADRRDAMFAGEPINATERRAVLHVALRAPKGAVDRARRPQRRPRRARGARPHGRRSPSRSATAAGPAPPASASAPSSTSASAGPTSARRWPTGPSTRYRHPEITARFVSNVDGADIAAALDGLDPAETLFIVSSKTFTTIETLTNARTARAWLDRRAR